MYVRRLISFGNNSFVVSLPKQWINKNKLKKGDLLMIDEHSDGLLLNLNNNEAQKEEKTITIIIDNKDLDIIKTEIVSAYLNNYNVIEIISKDLKEKAPEIKKILMSLAGLEILEQTSKKIISKYLIDSNELSIDKLIRRMDNITRAMIQDSIESLNGVDNSSNLANRDEEVNRLHFLVHRIIRGALENVRIASSFNTNPLKLLRDHTTAMQIERIADSTKRICRYLNDTQIKGKWLGEIKKLFASIKWAYLDVMKAYYTNDKNLALKIETENKKLLVECNNFFNLHNHRDLQYKDGARKGICKFRYACGATTRIIDNMKAIVNSTRYIARTVLHIS